MAIQFRRVSLDAPFSGFPSAEISVGSVHRDAPYCFLQHVLPPRLQKIRHYGFLSRRSNIDLDDVRAAILESLKDVEPDLELEAWTVPSLRPASHSGEDDGPPLSDLRRTTNLRTLPPHPPATADTRVPSARDQVCCLHGTRRQSPEQRHSFLKAVGSEPAPAPRQVRR
jgi:hypothetical protein